MTSLSDMPIDTPLLVAWKSVLIKSSMITVIEIATISSRIVNARQVLTCCLLGCVRNDHGKTSENKGNNLKETSNSRVGALTRSTVAPHFLAGSASTTMALRSRMRTQGLVVPGAGGGAYQSVIVPPDLVGAMPPTILQPPLSASSTS